MIEPEFKSEAQRAAQAVIMKGIIETLQRLGATQRNLYVSVTECERADLRMAARLLEGWK